MKRIITNNINVKRLSECSNRNCPSSRHKIYSQSLECQLSADTPTATYRVRINFINNLILYLMLILLILTETVRGFNIAPEAFYVAHMGTASNPHRSSYFGYSVGLLKTNTSDWLLVGAPRANLSQLPIDEPGSLLKCDLRQRNRPCEDIVLDGAVNFNRDPVLNAKPLRDAAWTGAALDIDREGNIIVCAPRWRDAKSPDQYSTNGMCYILGQDLQDHSAQKLAPLLISGKQLYNYYGRGVYYYTHGQIGMAVHLTDTKDQKLLLGAPGVLNWQGSVALLDQQPAIPPGGRNKREATISYETRQIPNPIYTSKIQDCNLFGYAVTSGKFDNDRDVYYVAGAPRGASAYGMVFVFLMRNFESQPLFIKEERLGSQMGEYFGASVAAPDLNGDGLSDLVVGAPLHTLRGIGDAGCVYVYMNNFIEPGQLAVTGIKLIGNSAKNARFGTALGVPGDLNRDGFEDLLVGAPYENNEEGAVYVFMGAGNGIREQYSQKLTPRTIYKQSPLKGFGISFSRPVDLDGNKYPDFAVGSFLTDTVAVMVTRPVMTIGGIVSAEPSKLSLTTKYFIAVPCVSYSGYGVPSRAKITVTVSLSQESGEGNIQASFRDFGSTERDITLTAAVGEPSCEALTIDLTQQRTNAQVPIIIRMHYALDTEDPKGPVMDPHAMFPAPLVVSFITGCRNDICHSDLVTLAHFEGFEDQDYLLIGSTSKITLQVQVGNIKEPAFLPNVTFSFPAPLKLLPILHDCTSAQGLRKTIVVCQLRSPLQNYTKETLSFDLDVSLMDDRSSDISIDLYSDSAADFDDNPSNNNFTAHLRVRKKAILEIMGSSNPEQHPYELLDEHRMVTNENTTVPLQHMFSISKLDITPLGSVLIQVDFPSHVYLQKKALPLLHNYDRAELSFHGKVSFCEVKNKTNETVAVNSVESSSTYANEIRYLNEEEKLSSLNCSSSFFLCKSVMCYSGPWEKSFDVATLTLSFDLNLTTLSHFINIKKGASLRSEVYAQITSLRSLDDFDGIWKVNSAVETVLQPGSLPAEPLAWWIYLLAILGGLLLLSLIAYGLYKIGFFRRKKKEQLQAQKATLMHQESQQQE